MENNNELLEKFTEFVKIGNAWLRLMALWNVILLLGYGVAAWLIFLLMSELQNLIGV